jgi:NAD(P)-dependent dehydrogenase (short-subunit alcohol dehydrogenase family)
MMRANVPGKASLQALRQQYALKHLGTVLEQAQAILFLTSAESSFVTGIALSVDGGRTFH